MLSTEVLSGSDSVKAKLYVEGMFSKKQYLFFVEHCAVSNNKKSYALTRWYVLPDVPYGLLNQRKLQKWFAPGEHDRYARTSMAKCPLYGCA
jgi:hypothetical protein